MVYSIKVAGTQNCVHIVQKCLCHKNPQKLIGYVIDKLQVAGVMKNKHRGVSRGVYFHNSGHEKFIKLILLIFCFAQRSSFPCDTQKRENVVTRLN